MVLYHIFILALVQGITEFLPVSSSGHLIIAHEIMGDESRGDRWGGELMMDVAVHTGTLFSVLVYFRKDLASMFSGMLGAVSGKCGSADFHTAAKIVIASVPVVLAGTALEVFEPQWLRSANVVAWTTLLFGILLWASDRFCKRDKTVDELSYSGALVIGISQALALVPGVSRSGITMTAGRFLKLERTEAARFSLLLAIVAISGAGVLQGCELIENGNAELGADVFLAVSLSFVSGWAAIAMMMRWLSKSSFTPFAVYRVALGLLLLTILGADLVETPMLMGYK